MKRFINNNSNEIVNISPNREIIHPLSLETIKNDKEICLTKYFLNNKKLDNISHHKCLSNENNYNKYLYIPPIGIYSSDILKLYNINTITNLYDYVSENIDNLNSINRILNCFIRENYDILIKHNKILEEIYLKIINYHFKILSTNFDSKEILLFINKWLEKHNNKEFKIDLLNNFILYIKK